jgi:hypothetical protein
LFEELRDRFDQLWDSSDPAERKHALWNLIEKITIKDKSFKIDFRVPELGAKSNNLVKSSAITNS